MSAHGSAMSLGKRVASSYINIVSLPYLMKLPAIFFASVGGKTIPLPKANVLPYIDNVLVYRR